MKGDDRFQAALLVGDEMHFFVRVEIGQAPGRRHVVEMSGIKNGKEWGDRGDLNPRPLVPQTSALTS